MDSILRLQNIDILMTLFRKLGGHKIDFLSQLSAYSDGIAELCDEAFLEEPKRTLKIKFQSSQMKLHSKGIQERRYNCILREFRNVGIIAF